MFRILSSRFRRLKAATDGHALNSHGAGERTRTADPLIASYLSMLQGYGA